MILIKLLNNLKKKSSKSIIPLSLYSNNLRNLFSNKNLIIFKIIISNLLEKNHLNLLIVFLKI